MAMVMTVSIATPLLAQNPCDGFSLRIGDIETMDCFTVKVPVRALSSSGSFAACNFDISGTVNGGNARIQGIEMSSGFSSYSLTSDEKGFTILGNDARTAYTSGVLQPPLFEVALRVDPDEEFDFDITTVDINIDCIPLQNYQCDESDFAISYVGLPFEGPMPATCGSESRDVEIFLGYPNPSTLSAATVDIPLKIRDNDNLNGNITLEKLDFSISYEDVYGELGLELTGAFGINLQEINSVGGILRGILLPTSGNNFTVFLDANGEANLATITVNTPTEPIAGGEIGFTVDFARIQEYDASGNGACCSPELGAPGTVTFQNGAFPCQDAEGLKVQVEAPEIIEGGKYRFPVFLYGPDATLFTIDKLLLEIELITTGGAIIDPATAGAAAPEYCPGGSCASLSSCEFSYTTNEEGYYKTPGCTQEEEYVLTACKTDTEDLLCGVSTGDLLLMQRHILGVGRFDSPRQYIAADADRSRSITALDQIAIRKAILGISLGLAGEPHWRFIPCGYGFPNTDPFETGVPECLEYSSATGYSACFDAIKIGDVDCSCARELATGGEFVIALKEKAPPSGSGEHDVRVDMVPDSNIYLAALQFALRFDTNYISFSGFLEEASLVDTGSFSFQEEADGVVRLAWYNLTGDSTSFSTSDNILSMVFTPQSPEVDALSHISIDTTLLPPLAFVNDSTALRVRLKPLEGGGAGRPMPGPGVGMAGSQAFSITSMPNPFRQGLAFHISAQAAMEARLSIFDARGKQVYAKVLALDTGKQKVQLPAADTWPEGAYFYHLQAGESLQSGRLVKLQ